MVKILANFIMTTHVYVTFQAEGFHAYLDAPEEVSYLRHTHRHIFHFKVAIEVYHSDREIEFIMLKHELEAHFKNPEIINQKSCEDLATEAVNFLKRKYGLLQRSMLAEVSEDNENGAIVTYSPQFETDKNPFEGDAYYD